MDNLKIGDIATNPTNLELIKLAKELAYSDYNNKKAELHNQWLKESDIAWRVHRAKVTYPPIPQFPTEQEILDRALKLIEFLNTPRPDLVEDKPKEAVTAGDNVIPKQEPVKQEQNTEEKNSKEPNDLEYARMRVADRIGESNVTSKVIPSIMQKLQDMKYTWK